MLMPKRVKYRKVMRGSNKGRAFKAAFTEERYHEIRRRLQNAHQKEGNEDDPQSGSITGDPHPQIRSGCMADTVGQNAAESQKEAAG